MDNQNLNTGIPPVVSSPNPQKSKFWKFLVWFVVIVIVAGVGLWVLGDYQEAENIEAFQEWVESTEREAEEFEARKAADTYGGATPQETLRMYIEAVERGDYELASRYFVVEKREEELRRFQVVVNVSNEQIEQYLSVLQNSLNMGGKYSVDGQYFSFEGGVLISTTLYPNGVWKIIEI